MFLISFCVILYQNAEFELHANQSQLDQMNQRGLQLLEDLKNVPNFDVSVLEQDLDAVNHKWESSSEVHTKPPLVFLSFSLSLYHLHL